MTSTISAMTSVIVLVSASAAGGIIVGAQIATALMAHRVPEPYIVVVSTVSLFAMLVFRFLGRPTKRAVSKIATVDGPQ